MTAVVDILSWIFLIAGSVLVLTGGIGVLRLPDIYTRSHAAGITDTLGAGLILIGLMLQGGFTLVTVKLVLILVFIAFTSPTSTLALIHTVLACGIKAILHDDDKEDES